MTHTDQPVDIGAPAPSPPRILLRRLRFPVLLVALLAVMAAAAGINQAVARVPILALATGAGLAVGGVFMYRWLSRAVELRPDVPELAAAGRWSGLWRGALLGFGLFVALIMLVGVFGGWGSLAWGSFAGFVGTAGMMATVAVTEECLFRGVVFRMLEDRAGTVVSLVVSSLLFGAIHLVNANATLWGTLAIAMTGGTMLAAAYVMSRSLWLPIGLHFAWNFTHAGIFGAALSGSESAPDGLFQMEFSGPSVVTGGTFGPEASVLALLVCVGPTVLMLRSAARRGQVRRASQSAHCG